MSAPLRVPVLRFAPTYRAELFRPGASTPPPVPPPFRVFYAGRVEQNKGVFALLDVAKRFAAEGRTDIEFDLCGDGNALEELRRRAAEAGVAARFRCHGHVEKRVMASWYQRSRLIVVPTTSDSIEGLNKVYGTRLLVGERTAELIAPSELLPVDLVRMAGKARPVRVFAPDGVPEAAMQCYLARDFEGALSALDGVDGPAARVLVGRIRAYLADPPGPDWDGAWVVSTK